VRRPFTPGRRFFATFGYALLQAAIFGSTVAALLYFRVPRAADEEGEELASHAMNRVRKALEGTESFFYDWRARKLGRASVRSDAEVALVAIDEETLANARRGDPALTAIYPWPRQVVGALVERILAEGAKLVIVDLPLWDASPTGTNGADDEALRAALDKRAGKNVLGFLPGERPTSVSPQARPYLVLVDTRSSTGEAHDVVRRVLAERRPAYAIPADQKTQVWAGVRTEEEGKALAKAWELKGAVTMREFAAADRAHEVTPIDLLISTSAIDVKGLDSSRVPRVRSLELPYAPLLGSRTAFGNIGLQPDDDGVVRGTPLLLNYAPRTGQVHLLPSAVLAGAMQLLGTRDVRYERGRLFVGDRYSVPVDSGGYSLVRWDAEEAAKDARGSLKRVISAWRLLVNVDDARQGLPPHFRNDLEGRVAIIVDATAYSTDHVVTPIGDRMSGGSVLAQAMVNLLKSDGIERVDPKWDAVAAFVLAFLGAFLALTFGTSIRTFVGMAAYLASVAAVAAAYLWVAHQAFVEDRMWLAVAGPLVSMALTTGFSMAYALRLDRRFRDFLQAALGRNLSLETIRLLSQDPDLLRAERRQVSVLRVRIEGFSAVLERGTPERVAGLLQEYLYEINALFRRGAGQVDRHVGDETTAFWGAPVRTDRHPQMACEAALELVDRLDRSRKEWSTRYGHDVETRIGVDTGEVLVGDLGSDVKSNYTVLGEAVRWSGRLCGETKRYKVRILVGEATVAATSDEFVFREVDRLRHPSATPYARVFELFGQKGKVDAATMEYLARYGEALASYHERKFSQAMEQFTACLQKRPDPIAELYVRRCDRLQSRPPPQDWDGIYVADDAPAPAPAPAKVMQA
jgi:adenylate cyclase